MNKFCLNYNYYQHCQGLQIRFATSFIIAMLYKSTESELFSFWPLVQRSQDSPYGKDARYYAVPFHMCILSGLVTQTSCICARRSGRMCYNWFYTSRRTTELYNMRILQGFISPQQQNSNKLILLHTVLI